MKVNYLLLKVTKNHKKNPAINAGLLSIIITLSATYFLSAFTFFVNLDFKLDALFL
jgi:hypothetical protein